MQIPARKQRSVQPLVAIVAIIAMPNLLSFSFGTAPVLAQIAPAASASDLILTQRAISLLLVLVGTAVWWAGSKMAVRRLMYAYAVLATVTLSVSLLSLVAHLSSYGPEDAVTLLTDALVVWSMIVLTFSLWYWLIDSGWPEMQAGEPNNRPDFLFVQQNSGIEGWEEWSPHYLDYLHLAFNTSTAFSPTDVSPLSQRAKMLMMVQSSLALIIVATVLARAINILAA